MPPWELPPNLTSGPTTAEAALYDGPQGLCPALPQARAAFRGGAGNHGKINVLPVPPARFRPGRLSASCHRRIGARSSLRTAEVRVEPARMRARSAGVDARGPFPADTLFAAATAGAYDAVLCMYHDQALIPLKTVNFDDGVDVTLGLPIVRTSPDHGTAFDIAGQDRADPRAMIRRPSRDHRSTPRATSTSITRCTWAKAIR